jgi:hypothetical protein
MNFNNKLWKSGIKDPGIFLVISKRVLLVLLPILLYVIILLNQYEYPIRPMIKMLRGGFSFVFPALALSFFLVFLLPGWWGRLIGFSFSLAVFGFTLVGLWASGQSEYFVVSGLIPFDDASSYLNDARRLLEGWPYSEFSSWRPLFPAFLAPILVITGQSIQAVVGILTGIVAVSCYLLARETQRIYGTAAAAFVLLLAFFYYRPYDGAIVPESLGFALGALGFGLLMRAAMRQDRAQILIAVFIVSLALFTRPGAFFVLIGLMIWAGWLFRGTVKFSWRMFCGSCLSAAAGFLVYLAAGWLYYGAPTLPTNYFFTYILYDLATGFPIKGGGQIYYDFPHLADLQKFPQYVEILRLAVAQIRHQPALLMSGLGKQYYHFFSFGWYGVYGFLNSGTAWITSIVDIGIYALCILGIFNWAQDRKDPVKALVFWTFIASLLAVPFVPPSYHNRLRLFAATYPVFLLLPMLGLNFIFCQLKLRIFLKVPNNVLSKRAIQIVAILLVCFLLLGPLFVKAFNSSAELPDITCESGGEAVYVRISRGSSIHIIMEHIYEIDWVPNFHNGKFKWYLHSMPHYAAIAEMEQKLLSGFTIMNAMDLKTGRELFLSIPTDQFPDIFGISAVCGEWSTNPDVEKRHFFYGTSVVPLDKTN